MPPSVGMRFGKYELLSPLAAGGMGEVWRARDHDLHREVAVKFLPEKFAADANRFSRFSQEALAASRLTHPNIITIHEVGQTSGLHYIVMEHVEGETLREILQLQGEHPMTARRLLDIGAQVAGGLAKAHVAGIVHRDLKPENVMLTSDGFVKILDFGLVKLRGDSSGGHEHWFDQITRRFIGRLKSQSRINYILNWLLFIDGTIIMLSGFMSSESLLPALGIQLPHNFAWRSLHDLSANLFLLLLGLHTALHWSWIMDASKRYVFQPIGRLFSNRSRKDIAA